MLPTEDEIMQFTQFGSQHPYQECPRFETEHFRLRLVEEADAADLFQCYSDLEAQHFFNADNCTSSFRYTRMDEMIECIRFWLECYKNQNFVRWSVIDKASDKAIGTVEMFGDPKKWGILRVDVASQYEKQALLNELFDLTVTHFFALFQVDSMLTKAIPAAAERVAALGAAGFLPASVAGREHYFVKERMSTNQ